MRTTKLTAAKGSFPPSCYGPSRTVRKLSTRGERQVVRTAATRLSPIMRLQRMADVVKLQRGA